MNATIHSKLLGHFDPSLQTYALTFFKYENSHKIFFYLELFFKGPRHRDPKAIVKAHNLVINSFVYKRF